MTLAEFSARWIKPSPGAAAAAAEAHPEPGRVGVLATGPAPLTPRAVFRERFGADAPGRTGRWRWARTAAVSGAALGLVLVLALGLEGVFGYAVKYAADYLGTAG